MSIRTATRADADAVRAIHLDAFGESEAGRVAQLAVDLLGEETRPPTLGLLAESDGVAVGHVGFSPLRVAGQPRCQGYILAPLGVVPSGQKLGVGSALVEGGLQRLRAMGVGFVLVYGDPDYYGRFGFDAAVAARYIAPYPLAYPRGWQAIAFGDRSGVRDAQVRIECVASLCDAGLW